MGEITAVQPQGVGRGVGGSPLYGLYWDGPLDRVWFLTSLSSLCSMKQEHMSGRRALVKLRISSHKLMIEISRYNQTWKDNRHCPFCGSNLIKDNVHFLFRRPTYFMIRNNFYN